MKSFTLMEVLLLIGFGVLAVSGLLHYYSPLSIRFVVDYEEWYHKSFEWSNGSYAVLVTLAYLNLIKK